MGIINTAIKTGGAALSTIAGFFNIVNKTQSYYKDTSLSEATKLTRVEPITIVSRDLLNNPETKDVLNTLLSLFTGYWLQGVDVLTKVNDVEVVRILDKLNPDRDETGFLLSDDLNRKNGNRNTFNLISTESYAFRLPTKSLPAIEAIHDNTKIDIKTSKQSQNSNDDKNKANRISLKDVHAEDELRRKAREYKEIGDAQGIKETDLDTLVNLSVGRLINVKIPFSKKNPENRDENLFVTIPVSIRLLVSSLPSDSITRILTYNNQDNSLIERFHSARSGRIEFIRDLVFCQDLIDEHRKALIKDKTNLLSEVLRRANNAKKFGLLSNNPSLVVASTLVVMSDTVARDVELKLGGKLSQPRVREKVFENIYAFIIAVVNKEWETVTFYIRGVSAEATFGFKEIQSKSKGTGPDVNDIFKAILSGQPPSF